MLDVIKIDSLQIRIPKYKVNYIDPTFANKYIKVYKDQNNNMSIHDNTINLDKNKASTVNGIKTRIAEMHVMTGQSTSEKQIIIQVNAKKLKERYLEGISWNTIHLIYEYLMKLEIVQFSYDDFLSSYVSDIDFCYDFTTSPETMKKGNRELYNNIKPSCRSYVKQPWNRKENVGINFNTRENATPSRPHIKIYHKTLELLYHDKGSAEFARTYLKNIDFKDIGRLEYTIKNREHRKRLKIECTTLSEYLSLPQEELAPIIFGGILLYIDKSNTNKVLEDLRGKDKMIYAFVKRCEEHGDTMSELYSVLHIYKNPTKKNRAKQQLELILTRVNKNLKIKPDFETSKFLEAIKVNFWEPGTEH